MIQGTVKWFSNAKGYGFIETDAAAEIFVHYSVIETQGYRSLRPGQPVRLEVQTGPRGSRAVRVVAASEEGACPSGSAQRRD